MRNKNEESGHSQAEPQAAHWFLSDGVSRRAYNADRLDSHRLDRVASEIFDEFLAVF